MKIVVIGGTGLIGSKVVQKLANQGHEAIAAAPNTGVDTITGEGLAAALDGADVVVDLANSPTFDGETAMHFFQTAGRNLIAAEVHAGVRHHIALSVVGTERLQENGYFRAKLEQERLIKASTLPYTIVHSTQFFEFLRGMAAAGEVDGVVRVSSARFQPIAADDVAAAVADAALAAPAIGTIEIAGPEAFSIADLIGQVLEFDKDPRAVVGDPEAPYFGARLENNSLMPGPDARIGPTSFAWWLSHVPPPPKR
jgi:uncharacterized protein YbjT (DUF2867 family)